MVALNYILEDDKDIIEEYCSGNSEKAATSFVRKYQKFVYATALRYVQVYDDVDDITQEVFIKALRSLNKFRGDSSLKTWLYIITSNLCRNYLRKKKVASFFSLSSDDDRNYFYNLPSKEANPEQTFQNNEFELNFLKFVAKLPPKQREVFSLRYFDNLSYDEISKMLGTTVGGLKANYFQAVRKIAHKFKNQHDS